MSSKPSHTQHSGTGLQLNQSATSQILRREYKKKEKRFIKYYNIDEPRQFAADRAVGNMHEHMAPILALFFAAMFACMYNGTSSANVSYAMWLYTVSSICNQLQRVVGVTSNAAAFTTSAFCAAT
eukprot:m.245678 g.245678  ORF g.245678 m.245678 type:complete len:125 (-) comp17468_c0_seq45:689-1063(-)